MTQMNWSPFRLLREGESLVPPRGMRTKEGIGDRMRVAAFAEIQARQAFLWAADKFEEAPEGLKKAWRVLAKEEDKHLNWLLKRMEELEIDVCDRPVSDQLWKSFTSCKDAKSFSIFMASAEDRGRRAGERFEEALSEIDPVSSKIFGQIALEEQGHIDLAMRYYPEEITKKNEENRQSHQ